MPAPNRLLLDTHVFLWWRTDDPRLRTATLPLHHRDPFDRLLIARAQEEDLLLVTHDSDFKDYEVEVLWT